MLTEITYAGHDNSIDLLLKQDGSAVSLAAATKITLELGTVIVSSTADSSAFDVSSTVTGKLVIKLGDHSTLSSGRAVITIYDASNTAGIVWDEFNLICK